MLVQEEDGEGHQPIIPGGRGQVPNEPKQWNVDRNINII